MRKQIVVSEIRGLHSDSFGGYSIRFVKPAAATVELISYSTDPKKVMHLTTRGYTGLYSSDPYGSYSEKEAFEDIAKTKLQTPFEMVHTLWLLKDVTRAFTHQLVRYRVGTSFIQESMRFFGMQSVFKVLITGKAADRKFDYKAGGRSMDDLTPYEQGCVEAIKSYVKMMDNGVASQDARGVLPTNILTKIFFDCSLRTLSNIMPQRLCCQAQQGEWQPILREMRTIISKEMGQEIEELLRAPYELGQECGYRASFDRPCIWRDQDDIADV